MRDIPVGNGSLLVNFDDKYQIRDVYFPHVGQENHTEGFPCRFGVWADGEFSWISDVEWQKSLKYVRETLVTDVRLENKRAGLTLKCNDTVASHENIYLRRITLENHFDRPREIRVFLHHDFRIYENNFGDTALYDPETNSIIHYKKHRYFLIKTDPGFSSFATGRKAFQGREGTWRDAEDGNLQGAAITEGSVDSTIGIFASPGPNSTVEFYYWIAVGTSYEEVARLDRLITTRSPQEYFDYTANYWRAWVNKNDTDLSLLEPEFLDLYKRSLLIIRTQIDNDGAILAANDHDVTERATDHYSYLWTRDGAFVANALDIAGYSHLTRRFFDFCAQIVHKDGYFLQKYNADGTVASGWHALWDSAAQRKLIPIQEDETALVLWALWEHYNRYRDIEFAHRLYTKMTVKCADFLLTFRDPATGLPQPSWNLWEDRFGIHTFTAATVAAGLRAAANFATLFAEDNRAAKYREAADSMIEAMRKFLYIPEKDRFARSLYPQGDQSFTVDETIDASLFGLYFFGCFDPRDPIVKATMSAVENELNVGGGVARFENDGYMRSAADSPPNPWFICTLWLADYKIEIAQDASDLANAEKKIRWAVDHALSSGVMSEQIDAKTGLPVSVSPLTWSHSTFVAVTAKFREKLAKFRKSENRNLTNN